MPFTKGQSGNPKGRPPKSRALAELLSKHASRKMDMGEGEKTTAKEVFAAKVLEGLTRGVISYPPVKRIQEKTRTVNGREVVELVEVEEPHQLVLDASDFIALARLLLTHLDGPVRAGETTVTVSQSGAQQAGNSATINIYPVAGRTEPPVLDMGIGLDDDDDV